MKKLSDICEVVGGTTPSTTNNDYWNGEVVWLSPVDLPEVGSITRVSSSKRQITTLAVKECGLKILPKGSLVYSTRASIGKVGIVETPLVTNQGFTNLIPSKAVDVIYLAYALKFYTPAIEKLGNSTTFKEVSRSSIKNFKIPLPPLHIQQQIADTLDKADALRQKDQQLLQKYDELAQSIFYDMFGDPVSNERDWNILELGQLCDSFKYGTNAKSYEEKAENSVAVIRIPNVLDNTVVMSDLKYSVLPEKELKEVLLRKGDLLFVRSNGNPNYIGRCAVYTNVQDVAYASYLIRARLKSKGVILPQFIQSVLSYETYRKTVVKKATTTAGNYNINTVSLKSLPIIIPPLSSQKKYEDVHGQLKKIIQIAKDGQIKSEQLFNQQLNKHINN